MTARAPLAAALLLALTLGACRGHASKGDCAKIEEHYLALLDAEDPERAKMTPEQKDAAREMTLALRKGEKGWTKATEHCAAVSDAQIECAMAAKTADAWDACLR